MNYRTLYLHYTEPQGSNLHMHSDYFKGRTGKLDCMEYKIVSLECLNWLKQNQANIPNKKRG